MKKITLLVAALAAAIGSIVGMTADNGSDVDASWGDTRRCATHREVKQLKVGMTQKRVKNIIDSRGSLYSRSQDGRYTNVHRIYGLCSSQRPQPVVIVWFVNNRLAGLDARAVYMNRSEGSN